MCQLSHLTRRERILKLSLPEKGNIRLSWVEKRFSRLSKYATDLHVIKKKNKSLTFPPNLKKTLRNFFQNTCYVTVMCLSRGIGWRYDWLKSFAPRQSSKHINRPWNDFSRTRRPLHVHGQSCDPLICLWFDFRIVCLIKVRTNNGGT